MADVQLLTNISERERLRVVGVQILLDVQCELQTLALGDWFLRRVRSERERLHEQRFHHIVAKDRGVRMAGGQLFEHQFEQKTHGFEVFSTGNDTLLVIREQRIGTETGHVQPAERDAVHADRVVRAGNFIVNDAGIIDEQISGGDRNVSVVNKEFTGAAVHQRQLHGIGMCMEHAGVHAGLRANVADIEQPRLVGSGENRLILLLHSTLDMQRIELGHTKLLFP